MGSDLHGPDTGQTASDAQNDTPRGARRFKYGKSGQSSQFSMCELLYASRALRSMCSDVGPDSAQVSLVGDSVAK